MVNAETLKILFAALALGIATSNAQSAAPAGQQSTPHTSAPRLAPQRSLPVVRPGDSAEGDDEDTPESRAADQAADRIDRENDLYDAGSEALDDGQYAKAAEKFGEVVTIGGEKADGALYWQAYAFNKLGRRDEALAKLAELEKTHPQSRWIKEAKALELEVRQAGGQKVSPESEDDLDIKLMAINGLINSDPDRAVPLLEKILNGNQTPKVKDRALFVLAQNGSARAQEVIGQIARGQSNPDLQRKALRDLGLFGGQNSRKVLAEIYSSSTDTEVKKTILNSFMLAGDRDRLLASARGEKQPEVRAEAVRQLGLLGAQSELWQLYQAETSREVKADIIQAMFIGGAGERLGELARSEKDPGLRRKAIRSLGLMEREHTQATLAAIYAGDTDPQDRREVIQAYFLQGNVQSLIDIARKEKDPGLRKEAIQKLSLMDSKEATDFLMEIINK